MLKNVIKTQSFQNIGFYFVSNILKTAIPFLVLPIITHYLAPAEYGMWSVYNAILSLCIPLTALGLTMIVGREFHLQDKTAHAQTVYMSLVMILGSCFLLFLILYGYGFFAQTLMGIPIPLLLIIPLLCFLKNIQFVNRIILRHEKRAKLFAVFETTNAATASFTGVALLMFVSVNWISLLNAFIIASVLFTIFAVYILFKDKHIQTDWDKKNAKRILWLGLPLMPHAIGGFILNLSDRLILEQMTDTAGVGIYSIGASLGIAVLLFCTAFNNSWGPWMHSQLKENVTAAQKIKITRLTYLYFITTFAVGVAVAVAATLYIKFLINPEYIEATKVAWWIAAGSCFYGLTLAINHYFIIQGKTKILPWLTASAAILNIALTIYLVEQNGMIGAAQATLAAYLILFLTMAWQAQRTYPMPWLKALKLKGANNEG